ncbi:hypothetical protein ACJRO7_018606 [Eucalyptus globulus]|uniref:Uncharacterized protein n=1 Tax=Eucalyptus globulus TaxID=34317 RepID=A0ABD3KVR1_EUCGL
MTMPPSSIAIPPTAMAPPPSTTAAPPPWHHPCLVAYGGDVSWVSFDWHPCNTCVFSAHDGTFDAALYSLASDNEPLGCNDAGTLHNTGSLHAEQKLLLLTGIVWP